MEAHKSHQIHANEVPEIKQPSAHLAEVATEQVVRPISEQPYDPSHDYDITVPFRSGVHFGREIEATIDTLDPVKDAREIYRLTYEALHASEYLSRGFYNVTFLRQAAVPAIAERLYRDGDGTIMTMNRVRNDRTFASFGKMLSPHKEEADAEIARVRQVHEKLGIKPEGEMHDHMRYTLATIVLEPARLRKFLGAGEVPEKIQKGTINFWNEVAEKMGIQTHSESQEDVLAWMEEYEEKYYEKTEAGQKVAEALMDDWVNLFPERFSKHSRQLMLSMLDEKLRDTLDLEEPKRWARTLMKGFTKAYISTTPIRIVKHEPWPVRFAPDSKPN